MTVKEFLENGNPEQIEKLRTCESQEQILALGKEFGIKPHESENGELSDEELEAIAGGGPFGFVFVDKEAPNPYRTCPNCGATGTIINGSHAGDPRSCRACGYVIN